MNAIFGSLRRPTVKVWAPLTSALLLLSTVAAAQDKEQDAERLFREGQKLLEERRYGEACPKFDAAYRKDNQLGTLLNLAYCHKEQGAIWQAWLEFREAELRAIELRRTDRKDFATKARVELERSLARAVIDNPTKLELTEVLVEDRKVPEAERGAPFAVEAGQRKFVFRAKGKKQATLLVTIARAERPQHVAVPAMEDKGPDDAPPVIAIEPARSRPAAAPSNPERTDTGNTQRMLGWGAIGVGGVAAVVGGVTGVMTITSPCATTFKSKSEDCTSDTSGDFKTTGLVSTVSFIAAAVFAGAGAGLLLSAPSSGSKGAEARPVGRSATRTTPLLGLGFVGITSAF